MPKEDAPALDGRDGARRALLDEEGDDGVARVQRRVGVVADEQQRGIVPDALRPRPRLAAAAVVQQRRCVGGGAHAVRARDVAARKGGARAHVEHEGGSLASHRAEDGAEQV